MMLFNANIQVRKSPLTDKGKGACIAFMRPTAVASLFILITWMVAASAAIAAGPQHPNMYLNQAEIDAISSKVSGNVEPWKSAYDKVMSAANSALGKSMLSVTFGKGKTDHQYFTEKPYCGWSKVPGYSGPDCRDGEINDAADRDDYTAAVELGSVVRDLGLAYAFTGEAKYADKVIEFVKAWSLNPETYMKPTTVAGNRIELFITLPGYFYGADLTWNYSGWDKIYDADKQTTVRTKFASWVKGVGDHARANGAGLNNFANWRVVLVASAGALLNDSALLGFAETEWKRLVPLQMDGGGKMGYEVSRSKGLHYSLYAINAMIQGAEILRHRDVYLYDYSHEGKGLELALSYITPYAIDPLSWGSETSTSKGYQQITVITQKDSMAMYELAYSYYEKESYLEAINRWKRPMLETRTMGFTTLTHGNYFDLSFTRTAASITTSPVAITVTEGEDASFSVVASGSAPLTYQWFRGGVAIPGATAASYTLPSASPLEDGDKVFHVEVLNDVEPVVPAISDAVMLTVLSDNIAPTLVSAVAASDTGVDIRFSEAVDSGSAGTIGNYQIDPVITVDSASLSSDGRTVSLSVSSLTEETTYTVSVSNVKDLAESSPNTIVDLSSEIFTYRSAYGFEGENADADWAPLTSTRWEVESDEGDMAYYLNTTDFGSQGGGQLGEYSLLPAAYGDFTFTAQARLGDSVGSNEFADYAVVFGYQDPDNYYYALFNNDQNSTQLFKVINGSRQAALATADSDWLDDNAYHAIEITREGSAIRVRFDGNLILSADDASLGEGKVGVGSFNDSAYFDDVSISGSVASDLPLKITTAASLPNGQAGTLFSHTMKATGGSGSEAYDWGASELPGWLDLDTSTGALSGTPATTSATVTYNFTITVGDGAESVSQGLVLIVDGVVAVEPLKITTASLPNGQAGTLFSHTMYAAGGSGETYTWSAETLLPAGLDLNSSTGELFGTPENTTATAITYDFTIRVEDGADSDTQPLSLTVDPVVVVVEPLKIDDISLPGAQAEQTFSYTMTATGGSGETYTWSAETLLPAGLDLNSSTGELFGTPENTTATAITYDFTIRVQNGVDSVTRPLSLTVGPVVVVVEPLKIDDISLADAQAEQYISYTMYATGGSGETYTWSAETLLPAGLNLTADGVLSGSPATTTTTTTYNFTIRVQDDSTSVTKDLNLTVLAVAASGGADSGSNGGSSDGGGALGGGTGLLLLLAAMWRIRAKNALTSGKRVLMRQSAWGLGLLMMTAPTLGLASVLSELAKTVQPGTFVELKIDESSVSTCQAMNQPMPEPVIMLKADGTPELDENDNPKLVMDEKLYKGKFHPKMFDADGIQRYNNNGSPITPTAPNQRGNILEFTDEAHWDSINQEIYIAGTRRPYQPWDQGFVKYSEATNRWTILDRPPFGFGAHGYDNGALDVARGTFYWSRVAQANDVRSMSLATGEWVKLPPAPIDAGQFSSIDYFPEIDKLVFFDARRDRASMYTLYDPKTNEWGPVVSLDEPFGEISHFSEYNPSRGVMLFGGGHNYSAGGTLEDPTPNINERRRLYQLDKHGEVTRLPDAPTRLGQSNDGPIQTIDPNSGNLVVFQGKPSAGSSATCPGPGPLPIWEYNFDTQTWTQTGTQELTGYWCDLDSVAVPLPEYGVNFVASVRGSTCKVFLYKHSPAIAVKPEITVQPTSVTVQAGEDATFTVTATGSFPREYQWFRGGLEIEDATSATYTLTGVTSGDNNSVYHVVVSNSLGNASSADAMPDAVLTVLPDITPPTLISVLATSDTSVDVVFSEAVSGDSAGNIDNYKIEQGIAVTASNLNSAGRTASLTVSELTEGTSYTVSVSNVQDLAESPNTIIAQSSKDFTYRTADSFEDGSADGWAPQILARWEVKQDEGDMAYYLNTTIFESPGEGRLGEYSLLLAEYGDFTFTAQAKLGDDVASNAFADYAVVFGFQDENNYYYAMFNNDQDATQLFRVVGGSREVLATATSDWLTDNLYHSIDVSRVGSEINVSFDGNLVMSASDSTFGVGQVGVGSFNDSAYFDDVRVVASAASNLALEISVASPLDDGQVNTSLSYQMSAMGGSKPYTWSADTLPAGLELTPGGLLIGTPEEKGVYTFFLTVEDSEPVSVTKELRMTVDDPAVVTALELDTTSLASAQVGESFSFPMTATGGTGEPYDWSISSSVEPAGGLTLNISTAGVLSGTPTHEGAYKFSLTVQDSSSVSVTKDLEMTVGPATVVEALKLDTTSLANGRVGESFSFQMSATGGTGGPYDWSISSSVEVEERLSLSISTDGILSGTPTHEGAYNFSLTVQDSSSVSVTKDLEMTVGPATVVEALKLDTTSLANGRVGESFFFRMTASGGSGSYDWSINIDTLPEGLTFNSQTGGLAGSPTRAKTYSLEITVYDKNSSAEVTETLAMTVLAAAASGGDDDGGSNGGSSGGGGSQGLPGLLMLAALLFVSRRLRRANTA